MSSIVEDLRQKYQILTPEEEETLMRIDEAVNKNLTVNDILNFCESKKERAIKELTERYTENSEERRIWFSCYATILSDMINSIKNFDRNKNTQINSIKKTHNLN